MARGFVRLPSMIRRTQSAPSESMREIGRPPRRRSSGIMKVTTLDESLHREYRRCSGEFKDSASEVNEDETKSLKEEDREEGKGEEGGEGITDKAEGTTKKDEADEGAIGGRNTSSTTSTTESTTVADDSGKKTTKAKKKLALEQIEKALDERRKIGFKELEIREYPRVLGDNPSCFGPPLTIGWDYNTYKVDVDEYEEKRPKRRNQSEMLIPKKARFDMLMKEWGYSRLQIASVIRANVKTRHRRARSYALFGSPLYRAEVIFQSASRKVKRTISGKKSTRKQYEEWKQQMALMEDEEDYMEEFQDEEPQQEKHPDSQNGQEKEIEKCHKDEEKELDLDEVERQLREEMDEEDEDKERVAIKKTQV